jgi:uncharacterized protein (UPF0210 family)
LTPKAEEADSITIRANVQALALKQAGCWGSAQVLRQLQGAVSDGSWRMTSPLSAAITLTTITLPVVSSMEKSRLRWLEPARTLACR